MKEIKNRIKSVENTRQITKAMQLVATSKLGKAKERIERSRPYYTILLDTLKDIANNNKDFSSPFTHEAKEGDKTCHIVIAGDRGLAGGYNSNLFKSLSYNDGDVIFPIGKKAVEYFLKRNVSIFTQNYAVAEDVSISDCISIGKSISERFLKGDYSSLTISYTKFVNIITQVPYTENLLPIVKEEQSDTKGQLRLYEPSPEAVFEEIVPHLISGAVYGALCESLASELSARRTAMDAATENAGEIIENLSLKYNRARQAAITQELTEIVAGSNI